MAPIVLFVYNRMGNIRKTVESLKQNSLAKESDLYIFSDGSKNPNDADKVSAVRKYIKTIDGFRSVIIKENQNNLGLSASIIGGVTEVVQTHGKVIVLEDDLLLSPYFLQFMNDALNVYEKDKQVMTISGFLFPIQTAGRLPDTFFLRFITTWGWATWARAWNEFNPDAQILLDNIKRRNLEYAFNIDGSMSFLHHLKANIIGRWNTWGIKWYASMFLSDGLGLFPSKSLVRHVGVGEDATHSKNTADPFVEISREPIAVNRISITENLEARAGLQNYYLNLQKNLIKRYWNFSKENLKRIAPIKRAFDFLRSKLYDERNAV